MAHDDIDNMLDQLRRIRSGGDLNVVKINQIESLEMELRFLRTFIKYYHVLLPYSLYKITMKTREIEKMLCAVFYETLYCDCETCFKNRSLVSQLEDFFEGIRSAISRYKNNELNFPGYEENDFDLLECLDYLDKNLNDAPRYLVKSEPFITNEIKVLQKTDKYLKQLSSIQKKMRFVRYLYGTEIIGCIEHEKLKGLQTRIQFMVDDVRQFCIALWMNDDEDNTSISDIESKPPHLLCLVVLVELEMKNIFLGELNASNFSQSRTFKNQKLPKGFSFHLHSFLLFLRNKKPENFPNNVCSRNIDVAIEFLLDFLDDVSNRVINGKMLSEVSVKVGALVVDVLCVIQKLLPSSTIIKDNTSKINLCSIQILENTKILKAQVESYYKSLKFTPSQFPILGGLSFLDSLLSKLNEMSKSESGFDFKLKAQIGILEKELSSLTSVFRDVAKVQHENEILKDLQKRTINLAYEAEVAIDSILVQHNALRHSFCSLPAIIKEIKRIHMEVIKLLSENLSLGPSFVVEPSKSVPNQHNHMNDEEIVGFENDRKKIFQRLIQGTDELDVIPIVGMGGQGKTTIARKVYNNEKIVSHFDVQVWCIISQTYNRRDLLQEIFSGVTGSKDKGDKDDILAEMVKKSLTGKRYLIVLDDMWDGMAWDDVRFSFPDVGNRSRIIVTTRLGKVGEHVKHHTDLYFLPFLTREESCQLLQKKVFQQDCPPELCDVSLEVAERCNGLPLVVVLVAGIIKRKKMEESWWREVEKSLPSSLGGELEEYSLSTIQLSYDNLPDYLRPCLLYMGMFQEDATIPVSKLISLWIAEGFVQNTESGRLEEAAEDYLMDLISSNVVMVSTRRYNGKVKYCQVHDVVLQFCLEKGRGEKFMLAVKGRFSHFQPSDWKEHRLRFNITNEFPKMPLVSSQTRKPFHRYLRSLIITSGIDFTDWTPIPQISKLGLLKVLDLSSRRVDRFSSATLCPLIHLKYLAVYSEELNIYPEPHLLHLETLIVKCFYSSVVVPVSFWKMEKLRHVEIGSAVFDLVSNKQRIFEESTKLEYLSILRKVKFSIDGADCIDVLSRRCPNLQELETTINFYEDSPECRLKLEGLTQLQQLDLSFYLIASELDLPSNLKKLALTGPHIVSAASLIAGLPNLEYLKLMDLDYESTEWLLGDIVFDKLKFLKLVDLGISRWVASEDSFPLLETLVIRGCDALTEIPLSFVDIQTLKQISLILCEEESLKDSAVQIKKEVEEIEGIDRLSLIIIE